MEAEDNIVERASLHNQKQKELKPPGDNPRRLFQRTSRKIPREIQFNLISRCSHTRNIQSVYAHSLQLSPTNLIRHLSSQKHRKEKLLMCSLRVKKTASLTPRELLHNSRKLLIAPCQSGKAQEGSKQSPSFLPNESKTQASFHQPLFRS